MQKSLSPYRVYQAETAPVLCLNQTDPAILCCCHMSHCNKAPDFRRQDRPPDYHPFLSVCSYHSDRSRCRILQRKTSPWKQKRQVLSLPPGCLSAIRLKLLPSPPWFLPLSFYPLLPDCFPLYCPKPYCPKPCCRQLHPPHPYFLPPGCHLLPAQNLLFYLQYPLRHIRSCQSFPSVPQPTYTLPMQAPAPAPVSVSLSYPSMPFSSNPPIFNFLTF